ncbi:MAG TPA: MIP family channel protein [Ktedonobacteraceae bacterium]|nr:MIP family channel protein [Ktedonobacteraceae bacterium]
MSSSIVRRAGAECIGSYALVTAGCGAVMVNAMTGTLTNVGVAFTFGLVIMVMVAATGHISGAHFNPAVTIAFALTRHFAWRDVPFYVGSQIIGAIGGAATLRLLFGDIANLGTTLPHGSFWQSLGLETLLTAILMYVIMAVATDTRAVGQLAALAIGATVALDALWGGPISGASMNPARSFGPALISGVWYDQWIYWVGPLLGACIGAGLYQAVRLPLVQANKSQADPIAPSQDKQSLIIRD